MSMVVRDNERSWAIELISYINEIVSQCDWVIKRAGGERTLSRGNTQTMFPDVMLFGDSDRSTILQGWELKMPDVPIEDGAFVKDAQRKAIALGLNSCLLWNFTYAVLYLRNDDDTFTQAQVWNKTSHIRTRADVETYKSDWKGLLYEILSFLNSYLITGVIRPSSIGQVVSDTVISELIKRNKQLVSNYLSETSVNDASVGAYIHLWWMQTKTEYEKDENNKFDAYAKNIILNWAIRIIFAHIIKTRQNVALCIDALQYSNTPAYLNSLFQKITQSCDFYNIFAPILFNEKIPMQTWNDLVELSNFLRDNGIESFSQLTLQNILEKSVSTTRREMNGQYTTPKRLAEILLRITVLDWSKTIIDCCCGTGTIPSVAIDIKKNKIGIEEAVRTVWACDKYDYPLQVANVSMARVESMHLANRLFKHNALNLNPGEIINVRNPSSGVLEAVQLPTFSYVVSNLPFVPFELIPDDDRTLVSVDKIYCLDARSDLYTHIAVRLSKIIDNGSRVGIITSNSWLGTSAGQTFFKMLNDLFWIRQIHISGKGRWFKNADIVTTLIVLEKAKSLDPNRKISFCLWKNSLDELEKDDSLKETLVSLSILGEEVNEPVITISAYSQDEVLKIHNMNVSYNAFFHRVDWLKEYEDLTVPIKQIFKVFRGSRRGWDPLFYPPKGKHCIEEKYLRKVLLNARSVDRLICCADGDAFCCSDSIEKMEEAKASGALSWIRSFEHQTNGVGKPLPEVLAKANSFWYELSEHEVAEFFTMMNPDQRLFFGMFEKPSFINQRLIGLTKIDSSEDSKFLHALLNSVITLFYIEASGFGRGLGVLDINKENISNCRIINPSLFGQADRKDILDSFAKIKQRNICDIKTELSFPDRIVFEKKVLKYLGKEEDFDRIKSSLISMQNSRRTAKNR